ncbi:MAG: methylmalonyl-CoA mutase family protein [bacterium]|nr:methylmalonyl-CoA mutase family protein [bacterium]
MQEKNKKVFQKAKEEWEDNILNPAVKKHSERKKGFYTSSNVEKDRLYTPENMIDTDYLEKSGFPGDYPYTRGVQPTMYRGKYWTMRQYAGFGTAEESNRRYKMLLEQGQTGLSVAFDLPTQIGYDSDDPISYGEVGKVGVAIDSLEDIEILFGGIPLDKVSTSMTINAPASVMLAMYIAAAEKQGVSTGSISGTVQNDILKEYVARGTYIFPPEPSIRLITDIFEFCSAHVPNWNTISISGYHIREAGSTAAQEIGFTLANGIAYVETALKAGLEIDKFAPRLSFFFNVHNDICEEIAKFRCARRLWANIMNTRFKAKDPNSMKLRFHAQTGGSTLTAQQPLNNIVRVTLQALAAVAGGVQSLHTNSFDEALALPTEESAGIALKTQQIIANESGIADVVDAFGGSYFIETLTDKLEESAGEYIEKIDSMGGMIRAIESGYVQREIQRSAYEYQLEIENNDRIIVGVNDFCVSEDAKRDLLKIDMSVQDEQISKLKSLRSKRDNNTVSDKLNEIKQTAETDKNLMPVIIDAVKCYVTLGEICNTLRDVFGEYHDTVGI